MLKTSPFPALILSALFLLSACAAQTPSGPDTGEAMNLYGRGMALAGAGQKEEAAGELYKAIEADPNLYFAYYQLGLLYRDLGRDVQAVQAWQQGLKISETAAEMDCYPLARARAEMQAGLAGLEGAPPPPAVVPDKKRDTTAGKPASPGPAPAPPAPAPRNGKNGGKATGGYAVLFSSNLQPMSAQADRLRLEKLGYKVTIREHRDAQGRSWRRVWVGCCQSRVQAEATAIKVKRDTGAREVRVLAW